MLPTLNNLTNDSLISKLKSLKDSENITLAEIVLYISEVDYRKLYRDLGYSSLFVYCRDALGYSESAAFRRIQAARSLKDNPEIYESIRSGKLSLCAIAEISKVKENSAKEELLKTCEGKSKREVQILTAQHQAPSKPKKEIIRAKKTLVSNEMSLFNQGQTKIETKESFTISIEVDKDFMELLNEAKALIGHSPTCEVFRKTLKEFITKRKTIMRKSTKPSKAKNVRFIPKSIKVEVRNRDKGQCTFVSADGRRCSETHGLEFDHIRPTSDGGSSEINNLRLVCRAHNLLHAERFFGVEKIRQYSL